MMSDPLSMKGKALAWILLGGPILMFTATARSASVHDTSFTPTDSPVLGNLPLQVRR
jgi:hypothetical protein